MSELVKNVINSKFFAFLIALCSSIGFWSLNEGRRVVCKQYPLTCAFYGNGSERVQVTPATLEVTLQATRAALRTLNGAPLIAHIDVEHCVDSCQPLSLTEKNLFLPPGIKLVDWSPAQASIILAAECTGSVCLR